MRSCCKALQSFIGMAGVACRGLWCVWLKISQGMGIRKSIQFGVIPTLFGCFLWIPSLYVISFLKGFFDLFRLFFFEGKEYGSSIAACSYIELLGSILNIKLLRWMIDT